MPGGAWRWLIADVSTEEGVAFSKEQWTSAGISQGCWPAWEKGSEMKSVKEWMRKMRLPKEASELGAACSISEKLPKSEGVNMLCTALRGSASAQSEQDHSPHL